MLNAGDRFGDYTVVRLLGEGGMGAVFLMESDTGAQVAAKILDPGSAGDHEARRRFVCEAQLALGVKHANLVETYDVGEDPETGLCYILMEYVSGGSLADRIKAGPLAIDEAVRITCQIASVLELARQKGIVHRDIKPANIMFGADGKAKLADLGIARSGIGGTETTTVTQTGMMIGTPAYMAPEQMLDAHHVDSRADIYSLGIVFYEMLTGQRPNKDDTVVQLMAKAVAGEPIPDVRRLRPEVSAAVAELISLMCAMKVDERIATPAEVATAIAQIAHGHEVTIRRKRPSAAAKRRKGAGGDLSRKVIAAVFGLAMVAGAAAFAYLGWRANRTAVHVGLRDHRGWSRGDNLLDHIGLRDHGDVVKKVVEKVVERTHVVTNDVGKAEAERSPKTAKSTDWRSLVRPPQGEILSAQMGGYTWYYKLNELGHAVLVRRGTDEKDNSNPLFGCVSPVPTGALEVPRELDGHPLTGIGNSALAGCKELTSVTLQEGLVFVDAWAFQHCMGLVSVKIPDSLKSLGLGTFRHCRALRTMDLNLVEEMKGGSGFEYAQEIRIAPGNPVYVLEDGVLYEKGKTVLVRYPPDRTELVLPKTVTKVFNEAFARSKMRSLTLPDSIECVDPFAFPMSALREIRFGRNLKKIKVSAFAACNLVRVVFEGDVPEVILEPWRPEGGMLFVPSDRRWIANRADLTVYVHKGTKGWTAPGQTGLPKLWPVSDRPEGSRPIRYIEDGMAALPDETAPAVPKQSGQSVNKPVRFDRRVRFAEVGGRTWFYTLENDEAVIWRGEYGYNNDTRPAVRPDPEGHVVVPAELDGHKVVAIGSLAFFRCRKMSSVKIPEGVRELRGWVFHDCDALAEVYLPKSLKRIAGGAFCDCRSLKSFDIGVCPDVPGLAFRMCDSLASVTAAPDNPSYVSRNGALFDRTESTLVFYPRTRRSAEVPASVRVIGKGAFCNSPIERIALPDSVERICEDAFFACGSLREITFGAGLKEIDESAFRLCRKLRRLDFPRSLKKLGKALTDGCRSLENVVFRGDAPEIDAQQTLFGKIPESTVIDVMLGTRGWNGPGSTDLPKLWPLGNFEDSRPIRRFDSHPQMEPNPIPPTANDGKMFSLDKMRGATLAKTLQKTFDQVFPSWRLGADYQGQVRHMVWERWMPAGSEKICYLSHALDRNHVVVMPLYFDAMSIVLSCRHKVGENGKLKVSTAFGQGIEKCDFLIKVNGKSVYNATLEGSMQWEDFEVDLSSWKGKTPRVDIAIYCHKETKENRNFEASSRLPTYALVYFQRLEWGK